MRILLLSDINSAHTQKWATGLLQRDNDLFVFSLNPVDPALSGTYACIPYWSPARTLSDPYAAEAAKSKYLFALRALRRFIRRVNPHLIHAHYATSYGLLGALSASAPYVISAWGSDILDFPLKSPLHRRLLSFILGRSDAVTATSRYLREQTMRYTRKAVEVVPFGITAGFSAASKGASPFKPGDIVVGVVKTMSELYGVDLAIRAFHHAVETRPELPLKLLVVGGGPLLEAYRALADQLGIGGRTVFTGHVPYKDVGSYHAMIDVFVNLSRYESFGVSVLEAGMSGNPAIVSAVGGLPELVEDGANGFVIPSGDAEAASGVILRLAADPALRERMGEEARRRVLDRYTFERSLDLMTDVYRNVIAHA